MDDRHKHFCASVPPNDHETYQSAGTLCSACSCPVAVSSHFLGAGPTSGDSITRFWGCDSRVRAHCRASDCRWFLIQANSIVAGESCALGA